MTDQPTNVSINMYSLLRYISIVMKLRKRGSRYILATLLQTFNQKSQSMSYVVLHLEIYKTLLFRVLDLKILFLESVKYVTCLLYYILIISPISCVYRSIYKFIYLFIHLSNLSIYLSR